MYGRLIGHGCQRKCHIGNLLHKFQKKKKADLVCHLEVSFSPLCWNTNRVVLHSYNALMAIRFFCLVSTGVPLLTVFFSIGAIKSYLSVRLTLIKGLLNYRKKKKIWQSLS